MTMSPGEDEEGRAESESALLFVVHEHQARRLHYDFRLELGGRLVCWSVPRGPSLDPGQRRLAVRMDDHGLEIADFEGLVPEGEYGEGEILLWDRGTWRALDDDPEAALEAGKLLFLLGGQKLRGRFVLVRTRYQGERDNWLLIKLKDRYAVPGGEITADRPDSVLTGRTLTDLRLQASALREVRQEVPGLAGARPEPMPTALPPMWPGGEREPFCEPGWLFEVERRGARLLAFCDGSTVTLRNARQRDVTDRLPEVTYALAAMRLPKAVFDGVVSVPGAGDPAVAAHRRLAETDRGALERSRGRSPAVYQVFDLLHLGDHSLMDVPLAERRRLLSKLAPDHGPVQYVDHVAIDGEMACEEAAKAHVRAVAKRADSPYRPGQKTRDWLVIEPAAEEAPRERAVGLPSAEEAADLAARIRGVEHRATTLRVGDAAVKLTNLDKVFWPEDEGRRPLLKRDLIAYYAEVSPWLLPYLQDRPLTLRRYVDGIEGESFYQRDWSYRSPDFARLVPIYAPTAERDFRAVVCDNLATLLWLANTADVELHAWYARCSSDGRGWPGEFAGSEKTVEACSLNYPDFLVFDLDPWTKAEEAGRAEADRAEALAACKAVAALLRERLEGWGLRPFVKTSGKTGLHLWAPLERRYRFEATREVARRVTEELAADHSDLVTSEWRVEERSGRVMIDHMQNVRGKTLPAPYSLRATPLASVSMPIRWEELGAADSHDFTMLTVPELLRARGDAWQGLLDARASLTAALTALDLV